MVVSSVTRGYNKFIQSHFRQGIVNVLFVFRLPMTKKEIIIAHPIPKAFCFFKSPSLRPLKIGLPILLRRGRQKLFLTSSEWYVCIARYCFLAIRMLTLSIKILYEILLK